MALILRGSRLRLEDVMDRLPHFIEEIYNQKRLHSGPDYGSPDGFEETLFIQQNTAGHCRHS